MVFLLCLCFFFFFNDTATTEIYTLSLHDALPIWNACAITAAFAARNYEKLRGAFGDHFHQPFREKLIPFLNSVVEAGEGAGALGGFLSGSGSTIACLSLRSPEKVATAMLKAAGPNARSMITTADNGGTRVLPFRDPRSEIRNHHASM